MRCSRSSTSTASSTTTTPSAIPAGDVLLARLGARLSAFVGRPRPRLPHGRRRVLRAASSARRGPDARSSRGPRSLSAEHGDGFWVGCSYGSIMLPDEATDSDDAHAHRRSAHVRSKNAGPRCPPRARPGRPARRRSAAAIRTSPPAPSRAELAEAVARGSASTATSATPSAGAAELHDIGQIAGDPLAGARILAAAPALPRPPRCCAPATGAGSRARSARGSSPPSAAASATATPPCSRPSSVTEAQPSALNPDIALGSGRMAIGSDTLKRTPLYDRHVAAGAKLVPFAGWEMPVQYGGDQRRAPRRAQPRPGVFDVSHMGEIETDRPGRASASCSASSPTTSPRSPSTGRSTACCARRTAASSTTSSRTSSADGHYLTVTNAANHEKDLAWFRQQAERVRRRASRTPCTTTRCSRSRGPRRAASSPASPTASCPSASAPLG